MPSSSPAVLAAYDLLRGLGYPVVGIELKSKVAANRGYSESDYKSPDRAYFEANNKGIGAILGPARKGPTDSDVDAKDCVDMADAFFPPTAAIFGRAGKPRSHRIYHVEGDNCPSLKRLDPITKEMIIELRADGVGNQTVFPGSIHESGELIDWSSGAQPIAFAKADYATLVRSTNAFSIAALIRRHMWARGARNFVAIHLSAMLFKYEWSLEEVLVIFEQACGRDFEQQFKDGVRRTWNKYAAGEAVAGASALKNYVSEELIHTVRNWVGSPNAELLEEYNERFAVVRHHNKFRVVDLRTRDPVFLEQDDFIKERAADYMQRDVDAKPVLRVKAWLSNPQRRSYDTTEFVPGADADLTIAGQHVLNTWPGWAVEPGDGDCSAWLDLLWSVICGCDEPTYFWCLNWFAHIIREPAEKPATAFVLIGPEGAGKTLLFTYFGKILGRCYTPITNDRHLTGNFNKHLTETLLLHSEEALFPGDPKAASIARSLISDPYSMSEPKHVDAKRTNSYLRVAFSTNQQYAVHPQLGDRRHTIIDMEERKADAELIQRFLVEMKGDGPAALHKFLLEMEYDAAAPRVNIKNKALQNQKDQAATPVQSWWLGRLREGVLLDDMLRSLSRPSEDEWPSMVSFKALHASFKQYAAQSGLRRNYNEQQLKAELRRLIGQPLVTQRLTFNSLIVDSDVGTPQSFRNLGEGRNHYSISNIPSLKDCQAAYDRITGYDNDWPQDGPADPSPPKVRIDSNF